MHFFGPNFYPETETWSTYLPLPRNGRFDINDHHLRAIVAGRDVAKIEAASKTLLGSFDDLLSQVYRLSDELPSSVMLLARSMYGGSNLTKDITQAESECMARSGFWLGEHDFLTSAHRFDKVKESNFQKNIMAESQDPVRSQVIISDRDYSSRNLGVSISDFLALPLISPYSRPL